MPAWAGAASLTLTPCTIPGQAESLRCGTLEVPEDRSQPDGRRIALNLLVIPAVAPDPAFAPLYDLAGGPGLAATGSADFYLTIGAMHRQKRDVVLVDQRGTGKSAPLLCPELAGTGARYPAGKVRACRKRLGQQAALAHYTTAESVADLEAVRRALRHDRVDVAGLSYGTRLALAWIDSAPSAIRSAVLIGTVPDDAHVPLWHARNAQDALDAVLADCAGDATCHAAFPSLAQDWEHVRYDPAFDGAAREALRNRLATTSSQRALPQLITSLAKDGFAALATPMPALPYADGLYLSITCAEDVPAFTTADVDAATKGTFLGDWRVVRQQQACAHWKVPARTLRYAQKPSEVPVLFLAGARDHVTPPAWAKRVASRFPRGRVVVLPGLSHVPEGVEGIECIDALIQDFATQPDAAALDTRCVASMRAPPFAGAQ
jgi:pimeloyl-ACP methyl ester carboxylesterase